MRLPLKSKDWKPLSLSFPARNSYLSLSLLLIVAATCCRSKTHSRVLKASTLEARRSSWIVPLTELDVESEILSYLRTLNIAIKIEFPSVFARPRDYEYLWYIEMHEEAVPKYAFQERYFNENVHIMSTFRSSIKSVLLTLARTDGGGYFVSHILFIHIFCRVYSMFHI